MVYRIAAVLIGLAGILLLIRALIQGPFYNKYLIYGSLSIGFVAYGLIGRERYYRLVLGKEYSKDTKDALEIAKPRHITLKTVLIVVFSFIFLFLVFGAIMVLRLQ